MTGLGESLRVMIRDVTGSAKKRRQISSFLKKKGFISLGRGGWLGLRNDDIVSGFVVEGSSIDTYISTFILPAYDRHSFITWALGRRVVHCSLDANTKKECEKAIEDYAGDIFQIRSSSALLNYLETHDIKGHYPIWVRYISYLRNSDFISAEDYLDGGKLRQLHFTQIEKFEEVRRFVALRDKAGVAEVLRQWGACSERIFGPFDESFCAL